MKKPLICLLALLASCTMFTACSEFNFDSITSEVKGWFDKESASESNTTSESEDSASEDTTSEDSTSEELPSVDPHVEALELAKEFVYGDLVEKDLEVTKDYTLLGSTYSFVLDESLTVSWTVDVTEGVVLTYDEAKGEWKVDVDEFAEEDIFYTLTATIADSDGHTATFTLDRKVLKAADVVPEKITEAPVEGEAYKLYMYQEQKKNDLYFIGKMSGFYLGTNNASKGEGYEVSVDVFVEKVEGKDAYYLTFTNAEGKKQYIGITNPFNNGKFHVNAIIRDTVDLTLDAGEVVKTFEYTWDSELKTLVATLEGVKSGSDESTTETKTETYFLGTSGSYYTFGAMSVSEASGAYVGYLVKMVNKAEVSAEDKVASEKETLNVTTAFNGAVEYTLPTQGNTYGDVAISWALKSDNATLTDNVLNVANPAEELTVVLTATFTCGEATVTKDVEITVYPKSLVELVSEPQENTAYVLYLYQANKAKNYYLTGAMEGNFLGTTDDATKAADVYAEKLDNGVKIYVLDATGAKSYIKLTEYEKDGKTKASVAFDAEGSVFTYNAQFSMWTCNTGNDSFYLGTYNDYTTISASASSFVKVDNVGKTQFCANFGILDESAITPPAGGEEGDDPIVPEVTTTPIATILASANGEYQAEGTVVAVTAKSFVLKDSTGMMLVYLNAAPSVNVGDKVTVKGTTSVYGQGKQFGSGSEVTFVEAGSVGMQTATSLTAAEVDAYAAVETVTINYVEVTATLSINFDKGYYNLTVDGATAMASISYPTDAMKAVLADLDGKVISVEGYFIGVTGSSTKYVQIMAVSVKEVANQGGEVTPPEGGDTPVDPQPHEHNFVEGKCECGETDPNYVPPHEHNFVEGKCECGETDPNYVPAPEYAPMTIAEAMEAAAGTKVEISGTVSEIYQAWNEQYGNISVYITDGTTRIIIFRATVMLGVGDVITVQGEITAYNEVNQIAQGSTVTITEKHVCSTYTDATCAAPATCTVCGTAKDDVLADHNYVNGACSVCGAQEGVATITASKTIAELIVSEGWTGSTTKQQFKLDDVVTVKVNGGNNTGKAYNGDHIRIYATDSPAGTLTISVADGYELVSVKISAQTGTYAFLYVDGGSTDICNATTVVSGTSVVLQSVKNGSDGKQVRVTAIEVVYKKVATSAPEDSDMK